MTQTIHAKNVILGAGAMGTATAYQLAKRGEPVLLIDQFPLGHDRGSSHGAARITRHSYADPVCARLMPAAFRAWTILELDAGQGVFLRTGGVSIGPKGSDYLAKVAENLKAIGLPFRRMSSETLNQRFPLFAVPGDAEVVFEPDAGMLAAARALKLELELALAFGSEKTQILEGTRVVSVRLDETKPILETENGRIVADRLIVTAGPWISQLLPETNDAHQPTRQQVLYFRPDDPTSFFPGRFPVFIVKGFGPPEDVYGMPIFEGLGVKVARHGGPSTNLDAQDREIGEDYQTEIRDFLGRVIPSLADSKIDKTEVCLYTVRPNDQFWVGTYPKHPSVLVASACSGHGFKFSCLIGQILADLVTNGETEFPIKPWQGGV